MNKHFLLNKKTIEDSIYTEGIGIHSGDSIKMRFLPANKNTGIVFINKKYGMKSPMIFQILNYMNSQLCRIIFTELSKSP